MSLKSKGIDAERELLHAFWRRGWPCVRAAGSGSMRYPSPDLLVGSITAGTALAIECKSRKARQVYLEKREVEELQEFSTAFGAQPFVAVRFDTWYFLTLEDLEEHDGSYGVRLEIAQRRGLLFEELIDFLERRRQGQT